MQRAIDLLPESMRARTRARIVASRNIAVGALSLVVLVVVTTHATLARDKAQTRLTSIQVHAQELTRVEFTIADLQENLADYRGAVALHQSIEHPLPLSQIASTVIGVLPESCSLERLIMEATRERNLLGSRRRNTQADADQPRRLTVELAGFAATDADVAEFVAGLARVNAFHDVSLDFSRHRMIRGHGCREFRLSFRVDLERQYRVRTIHALVREGRS